MICGEGIYENAIQVRKEGDEEGGGGGGEGALPA